MTEDSESASEVDGATEDSNAETEDGTDGNDEIELVFKPHPTEMGADNVVIKALKDNTIRYLKTTSNASVDHLSKYLAMRLSLDAQTSADTTLPTLVYTIFITPMPNQFIVLNGNQTLQQVNEKFWKVSWRKREMCVTVKLIFFFFDFMPGQQTVGDVLLMQESVEAAPSAPDFRVNYALLNFMSRARETTDKSSLQD